MRGAPAGQRLERAVVSRTGPHGQADRAGAARVIMQVIGDDQAPAPPAPRRWPETCAAPKEVLRNSRFSNQSRHARAARPSRSRRPRVPISAAAAARMQVIAAGIARPVNSATRIADRITDQYEYAAARQM